MAPRELEEPSLLEGSEDEHRHKRRKLCGNDFYKDILGSPKFVVAPMVDQSELVSSLSLKDDYGDIYSITFDSSLGGSCRVDMVPRFVPSQLAESRGQRSPEGSF